MSVTDVETLLAAQVFAKGEDSQGHVHGKDGKFVTKTGASKVGGGAAERIHSNGVTIGHIKSEGDEKEPKYAAYHPNGKDKYGEFKERDHALETLERAHVSMSRKVVKSPEKLHAMVRDAYVPGSSEAKNTEKRVPIHHIRSMMHDAYRLGAHYANPVKASRKDLGEESAKHTEHLHGIATKHLGEHSWDEKSLDKHHSVGGTHALRAVKEAFEHGKKMHDSTEKMMNALELANEIIKGTGFLHGGELLAEIRKSDEVSTNFGYMAKAPGSFEDMLRRLRKPLCEAVPCEHKPKYNDEGREESNTVDGKYVPTHWLDVLATYPDHAYVRDSDEDKIWKIPYTLTDDEIKCGEPEECSLFFATENERDHDADDKESLDPDAT